jgi:hypothetical protein
MTLGDWEAFDQRLRELEQWRAGAHEWRTSVSLKQKEHEQKIDGLRIAQAKWLGAIAVVAFLASMFGTALVGWAQRLNPHQ